MYKYFVSYSWSGPSGHGFGYQVVTVDFPLHSSEEIIKLEEVIKLSAMPGTQVVIPLWWRELSSNNEEGW